MVPPNYTDRSPSSTISSKQPSTAGSTAMRDGRSAVVQHPISRKIQNWKLRLKDRLKDLAVKIPFLKQHTHMSGKLRTSGSPNLNTTSLQQSHVLARPKTDDLPSTKSTPLPNKKENTLTLDDVSVVETDGSDIDDESPEQKASRKKVKKKVIKRGFVKHPSDSAGENAMPFGMTMDTGAETDVVAEDVAIRIHQQLKIPIRRHRKKINRFKFGNGQVMDSREYIKVPWFAEDVGLDLEQPWQESKFYIIKGTSMELSYDLLISRGGIAQIGAKGGSLGL